MWKEFYIRTNIKARDMGVLHKKITWDEFKDMEIPDGDTSIYELIDVKTIFQ